MPISHIVVQGECLNSLAVEYGLFADTIWKDPGNAEVKQARTHGDCLLPGDKLVIPDLRVKAVDTADKKRHRFRRKGVSARLRLRIIENEQPVANAAYQIVVDGLILNGTTDGDGLIDQTIVPGAKKAELILQAPGHELRFEIDLGHLDPITSVSGVQQRLRNLGFGSSDSGEVDDETTEAIKAFQISEGLDPTGKLDEQTRTKIEAAHDLK